MKAGKRRATRQATDFDSGKPPQWSPAMKAGKRLADHGVETGPGVPQWSPAMKAGKSAARRGERRLDVGAAMEPGHEGREEVDRMLALMGASKPQWSPAMKAGKSPAARSNGPCSAAGRNGARP